ncbi:MAG: hypothetical protein QHH05_00210 [Syntrophomonadaceae bacterium]|nr:hypothetical protein [Syntrophomonadaceae bacterium]
METLEIDFYPGILLSCYLRPIYQPGCMACADRRGCYGPDQYPRFRRAALALAGCLQRGDLSGPRAAVVAGCLGVPAQEHEVRGILEGKRCREGKLEALIRLAMAAAQAPGAGPQGRAGYREKVVEHEG